MIRLPVTSISLSDSDVLFHLQQIDVYHGLLKQGFKTADIKRYFEEHKAANANQGPDSGISEENSLSCVQLATRTKDHSEPRLPSIPIPIQSNRHIYPDSSKRPYYDSTENESQFYNDLQLTQYASLTDVPTELPSHRHAPRQSSLLRFAKAASPEIPPDLADGEHISETLLPIQCSYRPRTETYSYEQSEESETDLHHRLLGLSLSSSLIRSTERAGIQRQVRLRPDAAAFVPTQTTDAPRQSDRILEVAVDDTTDSYRRVQAQPVRTSSLHLGSLGFGSRGLDRDNETSSNTVNRGSFPANSQSQTMSSQQSFSSSPPLPQTPATPSPVRENFSSFNSISHRTRQQFDGESFTVYNDSLLATTQPQTPSDLARHRIITHHNASYTAPPGMTRTNSSSMPHRERTSTTGNDGEPSPTIRAIGIRERRTREMVRGVRVEGQRLERLRLQDRESIMRGIGGADEEDGFGMASVRHADHWRDELEGDRVGDENFDPEIEGDLAQTPTNAIMIISGNAQRRLG